VTGKDRLSLAAVAAALAAGFALTPLTNDRTYLLLALVLMLASAAVGAVARRFTDSELAVRILQLLPAGLLLWLVPQTREPIELAFETVEFVQDSVTPMQFNVGFAVFSVLLLWALYLLVESMAVGLAAPAWTFPALVTPYLITAFVGYLEADAWMFVLPAAGYALLLATNTRNGIGVDTEADHEPSGPERAAAETWRSGVVRAALAATVAALAGTLLIGFAIPERYRDWVGPSGPGAVQLGDPSLDLIRNLSSSSDKPVISYTSTSEDGENLRLAALPVLDENGFHLTATDLVGLPLRPNIDDDLVTETVRTEVKVGEFASEYLPVPWLPLSVQVAGEWRYDPRTLAVVAIGDGRRTASRNLTYTATSARLPTLDDLAKAGREAGTVGDNGTTLSVPGQIDDEVRSLATTITNGLDSAAERALAIRDYLRSGEFTYSTTTAPGTTMETLNDFLVGRRIGYCEQFAGGMAVLARMSGIPSRVVIGFLPGKKVGEDWQVSPRNMHAWTELYLEGIGWVEVDATPPGAVGNTASPSASPSATPTPTTASPTAATASPTPTAAPAAGSGTALPLALLGWTALVLAGGAALVLGPRLARQLLRARRLGAGILPFETAWEELAALARDRRVDWPTGSSRAVAAALAPELDQPARTEFERLALELERARYSTQDVPTTGLDQRVQVIEQAMKKRWAEPTAWIDRWWPRSMWPR